MKDTVNAPVQPEQLYETPDLGRGCSLLSATPPVRYKGCRFGSRPGQVIFQYDNDPRIPQLLDEYANGSTSNARALFSALNFLRSEMQRLKAEGAR